MSRNSSESDWHTMSDCDEEKNGIRALGALAATQDGYVDIIQPDLSPCRWYFGEGKKLPQWQKRMMIAIAPHRPLGPMTLASSIHLDATTPNFIVQEQSLGIHYNEGMDIFSII